MFDDKTYRFGCWNVRTMNGKAMQHADILCRRGVQYMKTSRLSLLGLAEMRWGEAGTWRIPHRTGDLCLFYSGHNKHKHGVGILMTSEMALHLIDWEPVSERIITATFQHRNQKVTVVQVYAPTQPRDSPKHCDDDRTKCDEFYNQLRSVLDKIKLKHKPDAFIVMGDFNAGVGCNNSGFERCMGVHAMDYPTYKRPLTGKRKMNAEWNTKLLMKLCEQFDLCVGGSLFEHSDEHKYTWQHPSGKHKHQIDHFLVSNSMRSYLVDVSNHSVNAELQPINERKYLISDHKPVIARIHDPLSKEKDRNKVTIEYNSEPNDRKRKLALDYSYNASGSKTTSKKIKIKFSRDNQNYST